MITVSENLFGFESSIILLIFMDLNHFLYFINSYYTLSHYIYFGLSYKDQPRVCGKDSDLPSTPACRLGSAPRVWERPDGKKTASIVGRISPACVGKTENTIDERIYNTDQPRVCGKDAY